MVDLESPVPVTRQLANWLRSEISAGILKPGDRLPSLRELARSTKVSAPAIHTVFKQLEKDGLIEQVHGRGSFVSNGLKPSEKETDPGVHTAIMLNYPSREHGFCAPSQYHLNLVADISQCLYEQNIPYRLYLPQKTPEGDLFFPDLSRQIDSGNICGLIGQINSTPDLLQAAERKGLPVVSTNRGSSISVGTDLPALIEEGVRQLASCGCRHLALIGWEQPGGLKRFQPFESIFEHQLTSLELKFHPGWISTNIEPWARRSGSLALQKVWNTETNKPDGILFTDDNMFQEAIPFIVQIKSQISNSLRIVSHTNRGLTPSAPFSFDRLEIDLELFAHTLVEEYIKTLRNKKTHPRHILLPPRLIIDEPDEASFKFSHPDDVSA